MFCINHISIVLIIILNLLSKYGTNAANCEIISPANHDGNELGFILIPAARFKGNAYRPITKKIQELSPGNVWIGLTQGWFGDFPDPLEIDGVIKDCIYKAG